MPDQRTLAKRSYLFLTWFLLHLIGLAGVGVGLWWLLWEAPKQMGIAPLADWQSAGWLLGGVFFWLLGLIPSLQALFRLRARRQLLEAQYIAQRKSDAALKQSQAENTKLHTQLQDVQQWLSEAQHRRGEYLQWLEEAIAEPTPDALQAKAWQLLSRALPEASFSFWHYEREEKQFVKASQHPLPERFADRKGQIAKADLGEGFHVLELRKALVYWPGQAGEQFSEPLQQLLGDQSACLTAITHERALAGLLIAQHPAKAYWTQARQQMVQEAAMVFSILLEKMAAHTRATRIWDDRNHLLNLATALPMPLAKAKVEPPVLLSGEAIAWEQQLSALELSWSNAAFAALQPDWRDVLTAYGCQQLEQTPHLAVLSADASGLANQPIVLPDVYKGALHGFWLVWPASPQPEADQALEAAFAQTLDQLNQQLRAANEQAELYRLALLSTAPLFAVLDEQRRVRVLSPEANQLLPWYQGQSLQQLIPQTGKAFDLHLGQASEAPIHLKATLKPLAGLAKPAYLLRMTRIA